MGSGTTTTAMVTSAPIVESHQLDPIAIATWSPLSGMLGVARHGFGDLDARQFVAHRVDDQRGDRDAFAPSSVAQRLDQLIGHALADPGGFCGGAGHDSRYRIGVTHHQVWTAMV